MVMIQVSMLIVLLPFVWHMYMDVYDNDNDDNHEYDNYYDNNDDNYDNHEYDNNDIDNHDDNENNNDEYLL